MWAYQTYIWEDHMGSTVLGGLEEKVKTAQKTTALIWGEMRENLN